MGLDIFINVEDLRKSSLDYLTKELKKREIEIKIYSFGNETKLDTGFHFSPSTCLFTVSNRPYLKENFLYLDNDFGALLNQELALNFDILRRFDSGVSLFMNIIKSTRAIGDASMGDWSNTLDVYPRRLVAIFYKDINEMIPPLLESIKKHMKLKLSKKKLKQIIEKATTFKEVIDGITCRWFIPVFVEERKRKQVISLYNYELTKLIEHKK